MSGPAASGVRDGFVRCLGAAVLFGASTPAAAALGERIPAFTLAGTLYLGAAIAMAPFVVRRPPGRAAVRAGARRLSLAVVFGGMVGPVALMLALDRAPASTVSLLLNLEVVLTAVLAAIAFGEHLGRRVVGGMVFVASAGVMLAWSGSAEPRIGALFAVAACAAWAVDNTVTANLDTFSPQQITFAKGLVAGTANVAIGVATGGHVVIAAVPVALAVGAVGYGASIVLWISGARSLGAARGQLVFAAAPFVGAALSWVFLEEPVSVRAVVAIVLAAIGVAGVAHSGHEHLHRHQRLVHDHAHTHDDLHHDHQHADGFTGRHSHEHVHAPMVHRHAHVPDLHHHHTHDDGATDHDHDGDGSGGLRA